MSFDDLKPSIKVEIEGQELSEDMTSAFMRVEVDLSRDIADQIKLVVANPIRDEFGSGYSGKTFTFLESLAFQPGNEVKVSLGYGDRLSFVAGGIIQKHIPDFPERGIPTMEVIARDASVRLMDGETAAEARSFPYRDLDVAVKEILGEHDIIPADVTPMFGTFRSDLQKKRGMTDYQFVKGLANIVGHEFRVRMNDAGKWEAVWRPPVSDQTKQYTFKYLNGPDSTLHSFRPEWGLHDSPTEVQVFYFDKDSRTWELLKATGTGKKGSPLKYRGPEGEAFEEITDLDKIRIAAGGVAVEYVPERPFRTPDEAERFAVRWLKARRDNFLTGRGKVLGLETLRAGDQHLLEGIGVQFSGLWEFTSVKHIFDRNKGYFCDIFANKVLT